MVIKYCVVHLQTLFGWSYEIHANIPVNQLLNECFIEKFIVC